MSYPSLNPKRSIYNKLKATQIVLIHWNQQLMCLHKITVVSGMALRAHFSLGIAKFDTLSNLSLTFVKVPIFMSNYKITQSAILNIKLLNTLIKQSPSTTIYLHGKFFAISHLYLYCWKNVHFSVLIFYKLAFIVLTCSNSPKI